MLFGKLNCGGVLLLWWIVCVFGFLPASAQEPMVAVFGVDSAPSVGPFSSKFPCVVWQERNEAYVKNSSSALSATYAAQIGMFRGGSVRNETSPIVASPLLHAEGVCLKSSPLAWVVDLANGYVWQGEHWAERKAHHMIELLPDQVSRAEFLAFAIAVRRPGDFPGCVDGVCARFHRLLLQNEFPSVYSFLHQYGHGSDVAVLDAMANTINRTSELPATSPYAKYCSQGSISLRYRKDEGKPSVWELSCVVQEGPLTLVISDPVLLAKLPAGCNQVSLVKGTAKDVVLVHSGDASVQALLAFYGDLPGVLPIDPQSGCQPGPDKKLVVSGNLKLAAFGTVVPGTDSRAAVCVGRDQLETLGYVDVKATYQFVKKGLVGKLVEVRFVPKWADFFAPFRLRPTKSAYANCVAGEGEAESLKGGVVCSPLDGKKVFDDLGVDVVAGGLVIESSKGICP